MKPSLHRYPSPILVSRRTHNISIRVTKSLMTKQRMTSSVTTTRTSFLGSSIYGDWRSLNTTWFPGVLGVRPSPGDREVIWTSHKHRYHSTRGPNDVVSLYEGFGSVGCDPRVRESVFQLGTLTVHEVDTRGPWIRIKRDIKGVLETGRMFTSHTLKNSLSNRKLFFFLS